jgi:hypothetical protein
MIEHMSRQMFGQSSKYSTLSDSDESFSNSDLNVNRSFRTRTIVHVQYFPTYHDYSDRHKRRVKRSGFRVARSGNPHRALVPTSSGLNPH